MDDCDTEKYVSSLIQGFVFSSRKWVVSGVFHRNVNILYNKDKYYLMERIW